MTDGGAVGAAVGANVVDIPVCVASTVMPPNTVFGNEVAVSV